MSEAQRIHADLGPTNTGKTYHAIERMLKHRSGIIGLPLRLLAREVYDRMATLVNPAELALVTGEERIIGGRARYWIATVEAMPMDINADIVVVDEIQLCADPERGYIFTDRLLNARGRKETVFLGSHAMTEAIREIIPDIEISTRPRLSELSWIGRKKLANLPPRSAIVSFSVEDVYATAEFLRRQHGGAAVVMGALSPHTRNAQVELYQSGDVDYIVATDAIGMGLNLDIDQVFFAGTEKFDGRRQRNLFVHEFAQIAGRAGRHVKNGGFGITAGAREFSPETIAAIEGHRFAPITNLEYRNSRLDFASIDHLLASLEERAPELILSRAREATDLRVLRALAGNVEIRALTQHPDHVELLWSVCQLPDYPRFSAGEHLQLTESIYRQLRSHSKHINEDHIARAVTKIEQPHHNIEILARKLSQIRTWTYIAQRKSWLHNAEAWRERTRAVEDSLSEALHQGLMQSFVDKRTSKLRRRLKEKDTLMAEVNAEGDVTIEGDLVGKLNGFRFELDPNANGNEAKTIETAAREALKPLYNLRSESFYNATDKDITLSSTGAFLWQDAIVGRLVKGKDLLSPEASAFADEFMDAGLVEKIARRLNHWIERRRDELFAPLLALRDDTELGGLVRGVAFQLVENFGIIPRSEISDDIKNLSQDDRAMLRKHGVRFGQFTIFFPLLLKPAPTELRLALSAIWREEAEIPTAPPAGLVTIPKMDDYAPHHYTLAGYHLAGSRAIRIDMLERLADMLRDVDRAGFEATPDMLSITGLTLEQFADLLGGLGYAGERGERPRATPTKAALDAIERGETVEPEVEVFYTFKFERKPRPNGAKPKGKRSMNNAKKQTGKPRNAKPKAERPIDPDNPFAALAALKAGK